MAAIHNSITSLRFFGDDLDPDMVTAVLGKPPSSSRRKGDVVARQSSGAEILAQTGGWILEASSQTPADLDAQVKELLEGLTTELAEWRKLSSRYRADVFVGLFMNETNEGMAISAETMGVLGARGIALDLDVYGSLNTPQNKQNPPAK
jgi:hypothetical protein